MNPSPDSAPAAGPPPPPRSRSRLISGRSCFVVAALVSLGALFYAEENWRGRRAWERCKRELEAKGEKLDWAAYIPPPLPAAENFLSVPLMDAWFNRDTKHTNELTRLRVLSDLLEQQKFLQRRRVGPVVLAEMRLWPKEAAAAPDGACSSKEFDLQDSDDLRKLLSRVTQTPLLPDPRGAVIVGRRAAESPARVNVRLEAGATPKWLEEKLRRSSFTLAPTAETNVFRLVGDGAALPQDVVDSFQQHEAEFAALAEACQRPHARLDSDYHDPFTMATPNYVSWRAVAQCLAARARARLLLGQPAAALQDLGLMNRLIEYLGEMQPTLVTAMIRVAGAGLYVQVVGEGLQPGAWQEPQWSALQSQLAALDLLGIYTHAIRASERAGILYVLEHFDSPRLARLFGGGYSQEGLFFRFAPRGWLYQNQRTLARYQQLGIDAVDVPNQRVNMPQAAVARAAIERFSSHPGFYGVLAGMCLPNFDKALRTTARNATLVTEALLACALERYRQKHGAYPPDLAALAPEFLPRCPHDLFTGQPLRYRLDRGRYVLYSVGWDGVDHGGRVNWELEPTGAPGDWVWEYVPQK